MLLEDVHAEILCFPESLSHNGVCLDLGKLAVLHQVVFKFFSGNGLHIFRVLLENLLILLHFFLELLELEVLLQILFGQVVSD